MSEAPYRRIAAAIEHGRGSRLIAVIAEDTTPTATAIVELRLRLGEHAIAAETIDASGHSDLLACIASARSFHPLPGALIVGGLEALAKEARESFLRASSFGRARLRTVDIPIILALTDEAWAWLGMKLPDLARWCDGPFWLTDAPEIPITKTSPKAPWDSPVVLLAFANDRTHRLSNLSLEGRVIAHELAEHADVRILQDALLDEIWREFHDVEPGRIQVFHFGGHADQHMLVINEGPSGLLRRSRLIDFLGEQRGLVLVFLNASSTMTLAGELRSRGVPAVISTARNVKDDVAASFATQFYRALRTMSLERAFQAAADVLATKYGTTPAPESAWGGTPWEGSPWEGSAWDDSSPWILDCDPAFATWRLGDVPSL